MLIFVVGFSAVATSQELRPEPQPDKIGIEIMSPFYTFRLSNLSAVIISDVNLYADRLENIAKSFQAGQMKAAATRRAVLAVVADFKKATRNYSRMFRAAHNLTGSTAGEIYDTIGNNYTNALGRFYRAYSFFEI